MSEDGAPRLECPSCEWTTSLRPSEGLARKRLEQHEARHHAGASDGNGVSGGSAPAAPPAEPAAPAERKGIRALLGPKPKAERRPRSARRARQSTEELGGMLWSGLAWMAERGGYTPSARLMTFETPVAGAIFEDVVKGTVVDKFAQPFVRAGGAGKDVAALIAMPLAAAVVQRNPAAAPQAVAIVRWSLVTLLPRIKEQIKREVKEQADIDALFADLGPMFGRAPGEPATIDDLFNWAFAPPPEPAPPPSEGVAA